MFFDFSRGFNTTQPLPLTRVSAMPVDHDVVARSGDHLSGRPWQFSDDPSVVGCVLREDREEECRGAVEGFVRRPEENHLQLYNRPRPRSWWWGFRWSRKPPTPISIQGVEIETVDSYKFLGVRTNNKRHWTDTLSEESELCPSSSGH